MSVDSRGRPELIFALVGPAGVELSDLRRALGQHLSLFGYRTVDIKISDLLENFNDAPGHIIPSASDESARILYRQEKALRFRKRLQEGAALARAAIAKVREERAKISGDPNTCAYNHAFVLDQLKHPSEVRLLRDVYGASFFLIAGHAPQQMRTQALAKRMAHRADQSGAYSKFMDKASRIVEIDMKQDDDQDLGQNTRDTYPLADFFANLGIAGGECQVNRFVDLLFAHPFHTPYPREFAMHQAAAIALRSSDETRQVGAVIVKFSSKGNRIINADIVAAGMNEVPKAGGGYYWQDDSPDYRDQALALKGEDRARDIKTSALVELIEKMLVKKWLDGPTSTKSSNALARELLPDLKGSQFMNISEFQRPVHAEMSAIIDAARRGVAVSRLAMYVTTFPCHNCAKHIIAAGIKQVIYLEPYPKSRAEQLHGEEIDISRAVEGESDSVLFLAFDGVAPRQYPKLFSMSSRGPKNGLSSEAWSAKRQTLTPTCVPAHTFESSVMAERDSLSNLDSSIYNWDRKALA